MTTTVNRHKVKARAKIKEAREISEGTQHYKFERQRSMTRRQRIKKALRQAK